MPDRLTTTAGARPLQLAFDHALEYIAQPQARVAGTATLDDLRSALGVELTDTGLDPATVIEDLIEACKDGLNRSSGSRFFGWVIGGTLPAALAADLLTSAWDQNAAIYAHSPAAAIVEEVAGAWLKDVLNIPSTASFAFNNGCQMAHFTALAAARHHILALFGIDIEQAGLAAAPAIRIFTSRKVHTSSVSAIRMLGIGSANIHYVATNDAGQLLPEALETALQQAGDVPSIVILQAGDVNEGLYDDFAALIPIAHRHNGWVHIDGAFGLWAAASPSYAHLLNGCHLADSWAIDGHKWLNVPYDSAYAFIAHPESHQAAMSKNASYILASTNARDPIHFNPEMSRRARGFSTYAALRELGRNGVASLVDRCCRFAAQLTSRIGELPHAKALNTPIINQGLVRFLNPSPTATVSDHDIFTDQIITAICAEGTAFFTGTTFQDRRTMRISVCNWQTNDEDIDAIVSAVERVVATAANQVAVPHPS
jgi:glutamate/tyrosine decarboxylase-like PLP-dependent enzyme